MTNPAFGSDLEPFHGIPTFMRLPASRDLDGVDVAIVGIPYVIVNGEIVIDQGEHTGALPGQVL